MTTTIDTILGGNGIIEGKRAIWQVPDTKVYDGGPDGNGNTKVGNTLFEVSGMFFP